MVLPEKIAKLIGGEEYKSDDIGMSGSSVLLFQDKVLKIQDCGEEAQKEYRMLTWLWGKLPVPKILDYELWEGRSYLLMSRCGGKMSCDRMYMEDPKRQVRLLARGLQKLWSVDTADCPVDQSLKNKLAAARYNVEHGLVDLENVEPDTFGENGFESPEKLLEWLYDNQPEEELVLSHGDYCLPNVFFEGDEISAYIDLGRAGVADKWCDIALCYRSLLDNYSGKYQHNQHSGREYEMPDGMLLFQELGIALDWEKLRYYRLLDELF